MLGLLTFVASVLYLLPLAGLVAIARRDEDDALDLACAIPVLFAADLLAMFVLTYLLRVEYVAFVRCLALLLVVVVVVVARRSRGRGAVAAMGRLTPDDLLALTFGAVLAVLLSWAVSGHAWVSDREWHTPFSAALRVQRMPYRNVYEPALTIRYHLSGDLSAAILQALSFADMNGSRAISIAHDLQSAILVGATALFFRATCRWSPAVAALAAVVVFLAGPIGIRGGGMGMFEGYADFSNFVLSFRPHAMVSMVLLACIGCHVARLGREHAAARPLRWSTLVSLVPLFALSGITDEISTAACGVALGAVWLLTPRLLGPTRARGALLLGALAVTVLVANLALAGTLAPGGPVEHARWVAPRLPHFFGKPERLGWSLEGWAQLLIDEGALIAAAAIIGVRLWRERDATDAGRPPALFAIIVLAIGLLEFLCFEVNGRTYEGHRFMTAARVLVPLVALTWLPRFSRASLQGVVIAGAIYAGGVATLGFVFSRFAVRPDARGTAAYEADCRADYGARLGEPMVATYVDEPIWHAYAGCRPIFAAGHDGPPGAVLAGWAMLGPKGFAKMDREIFTPGAPARVVCAADPGARTALCQRAVAIGPCQPAGTRAVACEILPAARSSLARP